MMFKTVLPFIFIGIFSFNNFGQQTLSRSITHDGIQRDYILYIPANYSGISEIPLLFNFHGYTSNATDQMWYGDFRSIADTAGFIIVHPEGTLDNTATTHFNVGWGGSTVDDVGFTSALIDSISMDYMIDQGRVYSTGMSNGGFMSFLLACKLSDRIAAIGSVTGSSLPATLTSCNATHPTPVLQIHGTSDPTVPYNGGVGWSEPISSLVSYWANFNNCDVTPQISTLPNISIVDGSTVEKTTYINGGNCSEVIHLKIINGAHTWPGTVFNTAGTNYDINASIEVWNFVSRYNINGLIGCMPLGINDESNTSFFNIFPNPSNTGVLNIKSEGEIELIEVTDIQGRKIELPINLNKGTIDGSTLSPGKYLIRLQSEFSFELKEIVVL